MSCGCSPLGGSGGAGGCATVWGTTWFVSPSFTGPTQNGSATCPFLTAQAAVDAAQSGDAIVLGAGDAGDVDAGDKSLSFFGLANVLEGTLSELGDVVSVDDAPHLSFANCRIGSIDAGATQISMEGCVVRDGPISCLGCNASQTRFEFADTAGFEIIELPSQFIDCQFQVVSGEGAVFLITDTSTVSFDEVSARSFQNGGWLYNTPVSVAALPLDLEPNEFYGDGSDGSLAAGFGTVTLTKDTFFANVAFQGGDTINLSQWRMYVSGVLDLRNAGAGAINVSSDSSITGIDGSGSTAGTAPAVVSNGSVTQGSTGGSGGAGGNAVSAGTGGGNGGNAAFGTLGGLGATGGNGGNGTGVGAGKGAAAGTYSPSAVDVRNPRDARPYQRPFNITARASETGSGGGGGGGGATGKGGGGGAAPRGGSAGEILARCVIRDSSTNAAAIQCTGPRGGNGGNGTTDGGGGGGAGGGGGSPLLLVFDWLMGTVQNCITTTGGAGGNGGNGAGAAAGGTGGTGASSGTILVGQRIRNLWQFVTRVNGAAGSGPTGATGGAGGAGGVSVLAL